MPVLDDALRRGAVSYSKTRAITRVATATNETTLLEMAQHATASQLEKICRGYRRALTNLQEPRPESLADEEQRRFVRVSDTHEGTVCIEARLRPEEAAVVMRALDEARRRAWRSPAAARADGGVAERPHAKETAQRQAPISIVTAALDVSAETPTHPRIGERAVHEPRCALARADALVAVAEAYLSTEADAAATRGVAANPIELVVHVDEVALIADAADHASLVHRHATLDDGTALAIETAQRFACDASVGHVATSGAGRVELPIRRTRRISATLRRALRLRDDGCRFPGCTNRITDAHHVRAWARGGQTHLANLCSLCRRHHRLVHEHGYRIETSPDGEVRFFRHDGSVVPAADGRRVPLPQNSFAQLRETHAARGVHIDGATALPRWDGGRVDYDLAVQALV